MDKFYITSVNAIMHVDTAPHMQNDGDEKYLKGYLPKDNVLWSPWERQSHQQEFYSQNKGLVGNGDVILSMNDDGSLTEYYSGLQVMPIQAVPRDTLNSGGASYYSAGAVDDDSKLYVPVSWLREITHESSLDIIKKMFQDKSRDIDHEIIIPLTNRFNIAQKNSTYSFEEGKHR